MSGSVKEGGPEARPTEGLMPFRCIDGVGPGARPTGGLMPFRCIDGVGPGARPTDGCGLGASHRDFLTS